MAEQKRMLLSDTNPGGKGYQLNLTQHIELALYCKLLNYDCSREK
jgi:hypothetical protein